MTSIFSVRDVESIRLSAERKLKRPASSPTLFTAGPSSHGGVSLWIKVSGVSQRAQRPSSSGPHYYNPLLLPASRERGSDRAMGGGRVGRWRRRIIRPSRHALRPVSRSFTVKFSALRRTSRGARGGKVFKSRVNTSRKSWAKLPACRPANQSCPRRVLRYSNAPSKGSRTS